MDLQKELCVACKFHLKNLCTKLSNVMASPESLLVLCKCETKDKSQVLQE